MPISLSTLTWRQVILGLVLVVALAILAIELWSLAGAFVTDHPKSDYKVYTLWGRAARNGDFNPAERPNPYPLPTTLYVYVPLSLLPDWFEIIWSLGPYVLILILFGRVALLWWLYYPMFVQGATGQIDGYLLLPLMWLFANRPYLAGIGAVLVLSKPQLAWLPVLVALILWVMRRDRKNLIAFGITLLALWGPTFLIRPTWPLDILGAMLTRANESILPTRGATLIGWFTWYGGWLVWFVPLVVLLAGYLAYRIVRSKPVETAQCIDLFITPVLYAPNMVMLIPLFREWRTILIMVAASWIAVGVDGLFNVFGGAYVIIPLTAMWLLSNPRILDNLKLPSPMSRTVH